MSTIELSLIIPTYNERANVAPLVAEIRTALAEESWEALFVDDSTDGTDGVIAELADADPRIRLLHRPENRGGLAGAVVDGLAAASGTYACVLDADLQHPPARIPALLEEARRTSADLVIASRYIPGGSAGGLDGPLRRTISHGLKGMSKLTFPRRLADVSDPLGGYFLFRRSIANDVQLQPIGYKILLEILIRCDWRVVREVPYAFQPRLAGESKADLPQGVRFLRHLAILAWDRSPLFAPVRLLDRDRMIEPEPALATRER